MALACVATACGGAPPPVPRGPLGPSVVFRYESATSGREVSSESLRGRPSVVAFLATYDVASQAEARFLSMVVQKRGERANVAAVVLEPEEHLVLVRAFRDALGLEYPVALADRDTIAGRGPLGDVNQVPSVVVLDAEGRVAWKHAGLVVDTEIVRALDAL